MRILGVDFTSAPSARKPLVCAVGWLDGDRLQIERLEYWQSYPEYERALQQPDPWVAGLDFPFAFPRPFSEFMQLPLDWQANIAELERFHRGEHRQQRERYREWIAAFRDQQPPGSKHPLRLTDQLARAVSPLMVFGVPVGMMLLEGALRLRRAGVAVRPLRPLSERRVALETYPALAVRGLLGERVRYKSERRPGDQEQAANRARLLAAVAGRPAMRSYGLQLQIGPPQVQACLEDPSGDSLDALLCALQAAWGYRQREAGWGVPPGLPEFVHSSEGWIIDPHTRAAWHQRPLEAPAS